MADTPTGVVTAVAKTPAADVAAKEKSSGIVAIDSSEHAAAKGVFQTLKDKADALGADLKEDFARLEKLLHL